MQESDERFLSQLNELWVAGVRLEQPDPPSPLNERWRSAVSAERRAVWRDAALTVTVFVGVAVGTHWATASTGQRVALWSLAIAHTAIVWVLVGWMRRPWRQLLTEPTDKYPALVVSWANRTRIACVWLGLIFFGEALSLIAWLHATQRDRSGLHAVIVIGFLVGAAALTIVFRRATLLRRMFGRVDVATDGAVRDLQIASENRWALPADHDAGESNRAGTGRRDD